MDDGHIWFELFIIVLLVLGNAVCSLAEIAIVGARKTKLQELADEGKRGAAQALKLTGRKEELFSTIQVGITTISIVTGMFSGASLAGPLADFLGGIPIAGAFLAPLSMFFVMALVTYFALIIGELAPKWIAIAEPEKAACLIARPMIFIFQPVQASCGIQHVVNEACGGDARRPHGGRNARIGRGNTCPSPSGGAARHD